MTEHVDVVVVGAGISGIGAGYFLQRDCPDRDYVILEGRSELGGTWDLFRYPGIRSDSDMHTLGYSFRPWTDPKSIADGPSILQYVKDTAAEYGIDEHMRFNHLVTAAEWSSETATWRLTMNVNAPGEATRTESITCNFLFMCSGYYSYKGGYTPEFAGVDDFAGEVVHPQAWPEELDYSGKRVVVIGSGATAMTLVPAMADTAEHVTMLQRSPTYVVSRPDQDPVANALRKVLPESVAYGLTRRKNTFLSQFFYKQTRTNPGRVRKQLLDGVKEQVPDGFDVDKHFTPTYNPWDQRLCLIPNGDLFKSMRAGKVSVFTEGLDRFVAEGLRLATGEVLEADIVVTATGLQLVTVGDIDFTVDGDEVDFSKTWTYKGVAYSDVPNMVSSFGYINASWTLRSDMTCEYVCRVLNHLRKSGTGQCTPRLRPADRVMPRLPWIDDFSSGYMQRMMPLLPKQGDSEPWTNPQNFAKDRKALLKDPIDDGVLAFTHAPGKIDARTAETVAAG